MRSWTPTKRSVAIGAILTVAGTAAHTWLTYEKKADKYPVAQEWAELERCLIGEPLAPGENVEQRLRMVLLDAKSEPRWPARCAVYARALEDALAGTKAGLHDEASTLRMALDQGRAYYEHERHRLRTLFQLAAWEIEGTAGDVSAVPMPPRAKPLTDMAPIGEQLIGAEIDPRDGAVRILFGNEGRACRLAAEARGEVSARCLYFPDSMPRGRGVPHLVPGEGADLVLRLDVAERAVLYSLTTGRVLVDIPTHWYEPSTYHSADGVALIAPVDRKLALVRAQKGAIESVPLDKGADRARVVGDEVLWREDREGKTVLFARHMPPGEAPGPLDELGSVADGPTLICRTPSATFVWITASFEGEAHNAALAVRNEQGWSLHDGRGLAGVMTCQGARASFVAAKPASDKAKTIVSVRSCGQDGCDLSEVTLPFAHDDDVAAAVIGNRVALMHQDGGMRLRIAALKELPTAAEQMVFDSDGVHGGSLVHQVYGYPVGDGAVFLLNTGDGTFAIGVRKDGSAYSVRMGAGS